MKIRCLLASMAAVLALSAGAARGELQVQEWRTDSGARVLFVESRSLPMLDVAVEFAAGSSRDRPEMSGLASLTLTMLRRGTQSLDEDRISERLADVGALLSPRFDVDRAGYELRTLSSKRERRQALAVLGDILQSPSFPQDVLEREKSRIVAALREAATRPATVADRQFRQLVFGDHPYSLPPAGEPETVARLKRPGLVEFYRRHYNARSAVVSIIGDVSADEARRIANQLTGGLQRSAAAAALPPVPALEHAVERVLAHSASQAHIRIGMPGVSRDDPDYFALWLGNQILGGSGFTSRLTEELRQRRGLTYSAYSYFAPYARQGPFSLVAQTMKEQAPEAVAVMRNVLSEFIAAGPTAAELDTAKRNAIGGFVLRLDSNSEILEYLCLIGFYDLPLDYVERFPQRIAALSGEQVREAFQRRVDPARLVTVVVGPDQSL